MAPCVHCRRRAVTEVRGSALCAACASVETEDARAYGPEDEDAPPGCRFPNPCACYECTLLDSMPDFKLMRDEARQP